MNKIPNDYVAMEQRICLVCGKTHTDAKDSGILINKYLKSIPKDQTITGYSLCKEDQLKFDDGYIALLEVKDPKLSKKTLKPNEADRTGRLAHIKLSFLEQLLDDKTLESVKKHPLMYIDNEAFEKIVEIYETNKC